MSKKAEKKQEVLESIPTISEEGSLGQIKINHSVVASIVRLSALEVDGVHSVGSSFVDGIAEIFSKKESDRGVRVSENEAGEYVIEIRVILNFDVELAKVAVLIQQNVREKISRMTMKEVGRVDVVIDGVRTQGMSDKEGREDWDEDTE